MLARIPARSITIRRVEGAPEEVHLGQPLGLPDLWDRARHVLFGWACRAPKDGSYLKTTYTVRFSDGAEYTGRIDLMHWSKSGIGDCDVATRMRRHLMFCAGRLESSSPEHRARYQAHVASLGERKAQAERFLDAYQIGDV